VDQFASFNTLPITLETSEGGPARSRIQVAEIGTFNDPGRYGKFAITQGEVDNWKRLLSTHFHGRIPIDEDHKTDKGVSSEAQGWIVGLSQQGTKVLADVEWTPAGEEKIRDKRYLYISPTFRARHVDDQGRNIGPVLLRAALTNNPFLHRMPAISLCGPVGLAEKIETDETTPQADSRGRMSELANITKALGLDEDATETKVLEAISALNDKATAEPAETDTKTLEAQAAEQGKVLLSADQVTTLQAQAAQGAAAAETLRVQTFETAYTRALENGQVDAKDETKTLHRAVYDAKPDESLKLLAALPKVVNLSARGASGNEDADGIAETVEIDGRKHPVDMDSARILAKAEKLAKDEGIDLMEAAMRLEAQGMEV
jgi:phage I-like protein